MPLQLLDKWKPSIEAVTASPGVVVVVGTADVGKTSFCTLLANHAFEAGIPTAIVDGDMGQSEIGPPTTISLGLVESPIQAMSDLKPRSMYFVGSTSPVGHLLETAVGAKKMVEKAASSGSRLVITDTTGLVAGAMGRRLKTHKIELLAPRHIITLQRSDEAEHFLRFFDTWADSTIHRLPVSPSARPKSQAFRTQRRAVRFQEYFREGRAQQLPLEGLATSGTWLHTANPMEQRLLKFAENALKTAVLHGERIDRGAFFITSGEPNKRGIEELQEQFHTKNIVIIPANRYLNLVVGLLDNHMEVLSLGIVREIDFKAQVVTLFTPLRSLAPVKSLRFGVVKVRPDGAQVGRLRPGDV